MKKTITVCNRKIVEIDISCDELINILCPELNGVQGHIMEVLVDGDSKGISVTIESKQDISTTEEM